MSKATPWKKSSFISIDLETTGQYPIDSEICEMAAVKWQEGKVVDSYSTLLRPKQTMSEFIISIHNITNEMVSDAPLLEDKIQSFYDFIKDDYIIAHHAPFDLGFLTIEFEQFGLDLPKHPAICSSLLARNVVKGTENHKLQTLVKHFGIDGGSAHRALDDSYSCLEVFLKCADILGEDKTVEDIIKAQNRVLNWVDYSMKALKNKLPHRDLVTGCFEKKPIIIVYDGGTQRGKPRKVFPIGLVRNPNGDYFVGTDSIGEQPKKFYLKKIRESELA